MPGEKAASIRSVINVGPVFTCRMCGRSFQYTPILMPATRPFLMTDRPGFMDFKSMNVCVQCVKKEIGVLEEKVRRGEMFPLQVWDNTRVADARYITSEGVKSARDVFPKGYFVKGE